MNKYWCVMSIDRDSSGKVNGKRTWCCLAHQPKREPRYSDSMKTACGFFITLPGGIKYAEPSCADCVGLFVSPQGVGESQ